jgi:hypothetical protein
MSWRGLKGPLFHGDARIRDFFRSPEAVPFPFVVLIE